MFCQASRFTLTKLKYQHNLLIKPNICQLIMFFQISNLSKFRRLVVNTFCKEKSGNFDFKGADLFSFPSKAEVFSCGNSSGYDFG